MNLAFENIIKATADLKDNSRSFVVRQLKTISNNINNLIARNDSLQSQISGVSEKKYNETLSKSIDVLFLLGFTKDEFVCFNPDFLNWITEQTTKIKKYNPRLMNYYLLTSMQQAYFLTCAEKEGLKPTYNEVRNMMLTFDETIDELESTLKLSLPELINKIDGKN